MSRESIIYFILNLFLFFICNSTNIIAECCKSCCNSSTDAYEEERIKNTSEAFYNCKTRYNKEIDAKFNEIKENNEKETYKNELITIFNKIKTKEKHNENKKSINEKYLEENNSIENYSNEIIDISKNIKEESSNDNINTEEINNKKDYQENNEDSNISKNSNKNEEVVNEINTKLTEIISYANQININGEDSDIITDKNLPERAKLLNQWLKNYKNKREDIDIEDKNEDENSNLNTEDLDINDVDENTSNVTTNKNIEIDNSNKNVKKVNIENKNNININIKNENSFVGKNTNNIIKEEVEEANNIKLVKNINKNKFNKNEINVNTNTINENKEKPKIKENNKENENEITNTIKNITNILDLYNEYDEVFNGSISTIEKLATSGLLTGYRNIIRNIYSLIYAYLSLCGNSSTNENINKIKLIYNKNFFNNFIVKVVNNLLTFVRLLHDKNIVFELNINNDVVSILKYLTDILSGKYLKIFKNKTNIDKLEKLKNNMSYIKISHYILEKILNNDINKIDESNNVNNLDFKCEIFEKNDILDVEKDKNTVTKNNENNIKKAEIHVIKNKSIFNNTVNLTLYEAISLFKIILYSSGKPGVDRNIYFSNGSFFIFCDIKGVIKKYIDDLTPENIFSIDNELTTMASTKLFLDIKSINLLKKIIKHDRELHYCELYKDLKTKYKKFKNILNSKINDNDGNEYGKIKHISELYKKLKKEKEKKLPDNKDEKFGSVNNEQINVNKEDNKEEGEKLPDNKEENSGSVNIEQINTNEKHINIDNKSKVEDITLIKCVNIINNLKKDDKLKQSPIQKIITLNKEIENKNNENQNDIENKDENINKKKELANKSVIELLKIKEDKEKELLKIEEEERLKKKKEEKSNKQNSICAII